MRSLIGVAVLILGTLSAAAQSEFPDITGTWEIVSGEVITHEGKVLSLAEMPAGELVIEMQQGPIFRGFYRWQHPEGTALNDGAGVTDRADEMLLGVFAGKKTEFTMVDTPDEGFWFGEIKESGVIVLRYVESGAFAAAGYSVMRRKD